VTTAFVLALTAASIADGMGNWHAAERSPPRGTTRHVG
jgi:hypothetical protein